VEGGGSFGTTSGAPEVVPDIYKLCASIRIMVFGKIIKLVS
jgi:hypothetical protein